MKKLLSISILLLSLTACRKNMASDSFLIEEYTACHNKEQWTQKKIFDKLIGSWQWQFVSGEGPTEGRKNAGLTVRFQKDSTLILFKNGSLEKKTRFNVVFLNNANVVPIDSSITQISGIINFCGDKVVFISSYHDGFDNFYLRIP
jgi:hypothetical protein